MNIRKVDHGEVVELALEGRFDANTSSIVEEYVRDEISNGNHNIIMDLDKVDFIASAGLRVILSAAKELRANHDGDLRISALQPTPQKVFEISGLNNVLKLFPDTASALNSFR